MILTRKELGKREEKFLASYAFPSNSSAGRKFKEEKNDERLCFQKDKDRIIHCKAFRRLNEKTQVFIAGSGAHYRTRLTHTLEVAQISRDIARRLALNEDLCEAIALAHDLGHPPFGHGGEDALNIIMKKFGLKFEHNEQSRRIVEKLEKAYPNFDGLNLTFEVLDGLIKHKTSWDQKDSEFKTSPHLEAQVVNIADEIAYTNHDIDDGLRAGLLSIDKLKKFDLWKTAEEEVKNKYGKDLGREVFISRITSTIISLMISDFCKQTEKNLQKNKIKSLSDVRKHEGILAYFSPEMTKMISVLRNYLYENFYMSPKINKFIEKGKMMIKRIFRFYLEKPLKFPKKMIKRDRESFIISVKDYIAGMTDLFLTEEYKKLFKR